MVETGNQKQAGKEDRRIIQVTVNIPWDLLSEYDSLIKGPYGSRSEAIREAIRAHVSELRKRERYKDLAAGPG